MTLTADALREDEAATPGGVDAARTIFASFARRTFGALSQDEARQALQIRPAPVAGIRRSGPDPYRILMFGGGALEGVGMRDHNLGLPGRVADQLAHESRRGVHLDVVVAGNPTTPANIAGLGGLRLRRYDAILVVLGEPPASGKVAPSLWRGALVGLMRVLLHDSAPPATVHVWDSGQAIAAIASGGRRVVSASAGLAEITEDVCTMTGRVRFGELPAPLPGAASRFTDATYQSWAELVVTRLRPKLTELDRNRDPDTPRAFRDSPDDERVRQRALGCLGLVPGKRDERLDLEVRQAQRMHQVELAALEIVDGEWTWTKSSTGPLGKLPRSSTISDWAIKRDGLTLINDTWRDPRTRTSSTTEDGGPRFYAGFPIRTWDGYRVGMLTIQDLAPQHFLPGELEGLRDITCRIERLIWNEALQRRRT